MPLDDVTNEGKKLVMLKVCEEKLGSITVLHLEGLIVNGVETSGLRKAVTAEIGASVVVLDLACVDLIDAGGLGMLLELREWTQSKGIELRLTNVTRLVQQVLKIAYLDSVFQISSDDGAKSRKGTDPIQSDLETVRLESLKRRLRSLQQNSRSVIVRSLMIGGRYLPQILWSERKAPLIRQLKA